MSLLAAGVMAQTTLPSVKVTAPYTSVHGGYLISGDFKVVPQMPSVVFPANALVKDDILSVQPIRLNDDEYLVVQECATADCSKASIVRVWNASGATAEIQNSENRIWIRHENKYFIWLKRLPKVSPTSCGWWKHPAIGESTVDAACSNHFQSFTLVTPPLMLIPDGALAATNKDALTVAESADPVPVKSQMHEGSTYVVTFEGGSIARIRRMHAAE